MHLDPSINKYILRHTKHEQLKLILLSLSILPVIYTVLEIPKHIINHALAAGELNNKFDNVDFILYSLEQVEFLIILCISFLLFILIQSILKYSLNVNKGKLAEKHLSELRKITIYNCIGSDFNKNIKTIPVVVRELEVISGFFGDIFVLPIFQIGTFATVLSFLFIQNFWLGLTAISMLPFQMMIIPKMQKKINILNRERIIEIKHLSERIGEINEAEIKSTFVFIDRLNEIRIFIFKRKFLMKALYNISVHIVPFFFYLIGGYLVINNNLTFGSLIAALAAYKDLSSPLKELFKYYQTAQDVKIRWSELQTMFRESY